MDKGYIISAIAIGFVGSLHCVGMCGPLMMNGIFQKSNQSFSISRWSIYHLGRIGVYAIWGLLFGFIGTSSKWFGLQQNISLSLGICILLVLVLGKLYPQFESRIHNSSLLKIMRGKLLPLMHSTISFSSFFGGMLNGMLPCGLVYVALAGATAMQNVYAGGLFMILFGLGNLPMLFVLMMLGRKFHLPFRKLISRWYPALIAIMAIMLIVRGLNWNNYFSPSLIKGKNEIIHCSIR